MKDYKDTDQVYQEDKSQVQEEKFYLASQWQLIWWKFRRHRLAMVALFVLSFLYLLAIFSQFIAPYTLDTRFEGYQNMPPARIHFFDETGRLSRPFIYKVNKKFNLERFTYVLTEDKTEKYYIGFFVKGEAYKLWGIFPTDRHLFGTDGFPIFLFGKDSLGRCLFTRILYGSRVSLSIGLVGVMISFLLGVIIGGISGYIGGSVDEIIQRTIDFLISIPSIPLWMTLSAALPRDWPIVKTYFAITIILSLVGWCGLARVVRGKLLALREEDFVIAARLAGASEWRIIIRHLLPSFTSHLIVSITLSIPHMILGETALSFLGLGMQPPAVSWGVLLKETQNLVSIAEHPWKLIPCIFVTLTVLMYNFLGDGLRDAADPYSR
jgi:peptide/nickel transport system permease protein